MLQLYNNKKDRKKYTFNLNDGIKCQINANNNNLRGFKKSPKRRISSIISDFGVSV